MKKAILTTLTALSLFAIACGGETNLAGGQQSSEALGQKKKCVAPSYAVCFEMCMDELIQSGEDSEAAPEFCRAECYHCPDRDNPLSYLQEGETNDTSDSITCNDCMSDCIELNHENDPDLQDWVENELCPYECGNVCNDKDTTTGNHANTDLN